jgi:hypothetical protein
MALLPQVMTEDEREGIGSALVILARFKYFERIATEIAYEHYNAVEGQPDDAAMIRKVRDGHAIKQYLMQLQSEAVTLGRSLDSEESIGDFNE